MAEVRSSSLRNANAREEEALVDLLLKDKLYQLREHVPDPERWVRASHDAWKQDGRLFSISTGSQMTVAAIYRSLEWDTRLLGIPAARLVYLGTAQRDVTANRASEVAELLTVVQEHLLDEGILLCDLRISTRDLFLMRAAEQVGFHTVDVLCTLGLRPVALSTPTGVTIRTMRADEIEPLADLSRTAYSDTSVIQDRFFLEPAIPHTHAQRLFREWFVNAAHKQDDGTGVVLVAEVDGEARGYIAMERTLDPQVWTDSLNAVHPSVRGRGMYRALVAASIDHAYREGAALYFTKTQISTARVINTWLHLGANLLESSCTLHWTSPALPTSVSSRS